GPLELGIGLDDEAPQAIVEAEDRGVEVGARADAAPS
ncbi:MAG: hypothetical protein QOJ71_1676, partial [Actinomycetota bacterium]|nr:hypothetical protein [Actinomycetota bacterium]